MDVDGGAVRVATEPGLVRCPWHRWDFDVASGRCREAPKLRVRRYRVALHADGVEIDLAPLRD
jgi:nitrite reductase/ring-hydroxylating ferredoxin subunit